ncbi:putative plant self-incompatibility S1 [Helianthus anomalus]
MRSFLFIFFFFFFASISNTSVVADESLDTPCIIFDRFHMYVINNIPAEIKLHAYSKDDDLGYHILPYYAFYDWSFCFGPKTLFSGQLWWGSKYIALNLVDNHVHKMCDRQMFGVRHCYWLVRPEGFYIGVKNNTWPDASWVFQTPWP